MTLRNNLMIMASLLALGTSSAFALESSNTTAPATHEFHKLTPEQHEAKKAEFKAKLDAMTPEEREKFKTERKEKWKERYDNATPEQQEKMREHRKERREHHKSMKEHAPAPAATTTPAK